MRVAMGIGVLSGLAVSVSGQDFAYTLVAPDVVDAFSDTSFTVTVLATGPGTHIAGGGFALSGRDSGGVIDDISWAAADWSAVNTDGGYAGGASYNPVSFGQFILPDFGFPPADSSVLPAVVGVFTFFLNDNRVSTLALQLTDAGFDFGMETFDDADDSFTRDGGAIRYDAARIRVIPGPAPLAVLAAGGLIAARRRR